MSRRARAASLAAALLVAGCGSKGASSTPAPAPSPSATSSPPPVSDAGLVGRAVKVMVINMFSGEAQPFITGLGLTQSTPVVGLSPGAPAVLCNADDVCEITTGMGYANAASSITALVYRGNFDLTHTYFIVAGIAGIDPAQGTLGSAAWGRYIVDFGLASELDAREMPAGWPYGYVGVGAQTPAGTPATVYGTEVFQLGEAFLQAAYALSKQATLDDSPTAMQSRAMYASAPANQPPRVIQCDAASGDTWWVGTALTQRARDWVKLRTAGKGVFCTSQQEDNATFEALRRASVAGKVDITRVAELRSGSDFTAPYDGQADSALLLSSLAEGGLEIATSNLMKAAGPVIAAIVGGWGQWQAGVPR